MVSGKHVFLATLDWGPQEDTNYAAFTSLGKAKIHIEAVMRTFMPFAWTSHPDIPDVWGWYNDELQVGATIARMRLNPPVELGGPKDWSPA